MHHTDGVIGSRIISIVLRNLAVVGLYYPTKLLLTAYSPSYFRYVELVKHLVVHPDAPVWTFGVIILDPALYDIFKLASTKTYKETQTLALEITNERLGNCICSWGSGWNSDTLYIFRFPKFIEFIWIFPVTITNKKSWFKA